MIMYNQPNWRDVLIGKDKNVARLDYRMPTEEDSRYQYRVSRAMKNLKRFNEKFNNGNSEVVDRFSVGEKATHMHHIFPKNQFQAIADYIENLMFYTGYNLIHSKSGARHQYLAGSCA